MGFNSLEIECYTTLPEPTPAPLRCDICHKEQEEVLCFPASRRICRACLADIAEDEQWSMDDLAGFLCAAIEGE